MTTKQKIESVRYGLKQYLRDNELPNESFPDEIVALGLLLHLQCPLNYTPDSKIVYTFKTKPMILNDKQTK